MSQDNCEIEMKFPVTPSLFEDISTRLATVAEYKGEVHQIDRYYNAPHRDFLKPLHPVEYLRIREKGGRGILAYKYAHLDDHGQKTHCDEFETAFDDAFQARKILEALNFKEYLKIDNNRKEYVYENDFEIVLDKVADLGCFVEVESKKLLGSIEETNALIVNIAKALGINPDVRDNDGYVLAMMKKKGLR